MPKTMEQLIIQFDSSSALLKSLALYYKGEDFKGGGVAPGIPSWVGQLINAIPRRLRQSLYSWSGWFDALNARDLDDLDMNAAASWAARLYPSKTYSGVMFGSSNGAAIHLAAALGMPWLPQTYLVAVQRHLRPDQIHQDIRWGQETITPLLRRFPQVHAAQMHDPVQDRLMVSKMGYFRLKLLGLPPAFTDFMALHLSPSQPLISVECTYAWPIRQIEARHTFQLGGFGNIDPYEYLKGSQRTRDFLKKVGAPVSHWETFEPTKEVPESEWGFYPDALDDLRSAAHQHRAPFYRLIFDHPEGLSAFACDLYQFWFQKRLGFDCRRVLIENFALMAPYRALRAAALPFWLAFNTKNSADLLEQFLEERGRFEELYLLLMSNGVAEGIGLTEIGRWREILSHASKKAKFIGVDQEEYPLDFATFMRYHIELLEELPDRIAPPAPLTMADIEEFLKTQKRTYPLTLRKEF